jgi:hypothetical protein
MIHPIAFFLFCSCNSIYTNLQYSSLGTEVHRGRGKIPVADYKVASYVSREDGKTPSSSGPTSRSCYSFCMCPGGQVYLFVWIFSAKNIDLNVVILLNTAFQSLRLLLLLHL